MTVKLKSETEMKNVFINYINQYLLFTSNETRKNLTLLSTVHDLKRKPIRQLPYFHDMRKFLFFFKWKKEKKKFPLLVLLMLIKKLLIK